MAVQMREDGSQDWGACWEGAGRWHLGCGLKAGPTGLLMVGCGV